MSIEQTAAQLSIAMDTVDELTLLLRKTQAKLGDVQDLFVEINGYSQSFTLRRILNLLAELDDQLDKNMGSSILTKELAVKMLDHLRS